MRTTCGARPCNGNDHADVAKRATARIVADLTAAMEHGPMVRVARHGELPTADGWVVDVGIRWCILVATQDATTGRYRAVRLRDITSVRTRDHTADDTAPTRNPRIAAPIGVDATSTGTLLATAGDAFGLVTVHLERRRAKRRACVGRVVWLADKRVTLGLVDPTTFSRRRARTIRFRDISLIEFG
jgi:hypothetical protein